MAITRFPNIDIPIVQVAVTQSGAAPSELESQVTKKVEDAVSNVNGVWHMISTVTDGSSVTVVQFTVGAVDIDRALNDVKDQIAKIRADLPRTIDEPIVSRIDVEGLPIVTYAASAPGHDRRATVLVRRRHGGARAAEREGRRRGQALRRRRPRDPRRARPRQAAGARRHRRRRSTRRCAPTTSTSAAAAARSAGQEQAIRTLAGARTRRRSRRDCRSRCRAAARCGSTNSATVTDGAAEPRTFARLFDEPIVAFGVTRAKGASDVDGRPASSPSGSTRIQADHPEVSFTKVDTQVDNELGNYSSTMETLIEGALLAVIVVLRVPARLARDARHRGRAAAVDHPDLLGDGRDRLLAQPRQPARDHAGDRHSGRRRHRRDREHRAPHAHGQVGLSRRARGRRRDRPGGHRHLAAPSSRSSRR